MTFAALFSTLAGLGLVLALIALGVRLLQGRVPGGRAGTARLPMEVVGRVALGPKQGLAAVRVADRVLLVSMGEGGVQRVSELPADAALPLPAAEPDADADVPFAQRLRALMPAAMGLLVVAIAGALLAEPAAAQAAAQAADPAAAVTAALPKVSLQVGDASDGLRLSGTVGTVLVIGMMTLLPTLLLLMTSFTRILVVMHFLKQAIGTQTAPPAHLIAALSLLLTGFVMGPTLERANDTALRPWMEGRMDEAQMMKTAVVPFREFMLEHVRENDVAVFLDLSGRERPETVEEVPTLVLASAFATSELRTAFQIGFMIFLPFLVIDLVVAAVLMSLGMFMLPPVMVSLPFKLLLFVLVDGWTLIVRTLVSSFA